MILGLNGVVVARHGLILRENDATGVRKVCKYLPGLWDHTENLKIGFEVQKYDFSIYVRIF